MCPACLVLPDGPSIPVIKTMTINFFRLIVSVVLATQLGAALATTGVKQIVLVQNSGWMLPFYEDPKKQFKQTVIDFASRVAPYGSELVIASFNQSVGDNKSPQLEYSGSDLSAVAASVNAIALVKKPGTSVYADTDFLEAITGAISQFTPGQPAIVWIVTNNKNSPNNSLETVKKNSEFYGFLQNTKEISRIVGYPQRLEVNSKITGFSANGLMFYGVAYGEVADAVLANMVESKKVFGQANVARLKPLNSEAITFVPTGVSDPNVKAGLSAADGKTLILSLDSDTYNQSFQITGVLRNDFYPYDIESGKLSITSQGFDQNTTGPLVVNADSSIKELALGVGEDSPVISLSLSLPAMPPAFSLDVIFGSGFKIAGVLEFSLDEQKLRIARSFTQDMGALFPGDPLPDLFNPGATSRNSVTFQPIVIEVVYPVWPTLLLGGLFLLVVLLILAAMLLMGRTTKFKVTIDSDERIYAMKPFAKVAVNNIRGERVGVIQRGFGMPVAKLDAKFKAVNIKIKPY
jgi:hypothetical protein